MVACVLADAGNATAPRVVAPARPTAANRTNFGVRTLMMKLTFSTISSYLMGIVN